MFPYIYISLLEVIGTNLIFFLKNPNKSSVLLMFFNKEYSKNNYSAPLLKGCAHVVESWR